MDSPPPLSARRSDRRHSRVSKPPSPAARSEVLAPGSLFAGLAVGYLPRHEGPSILEYSSASSLLADERESPSNPGGFWSGRQSRRAFLCCFISSGQNRCRPRGFCRKDGRRQLRSADFQSAVSPASSRRTVGGSRRRRIGEPRHSRLETGATLVAASPRRVVRNCFGRPRRLRPGWPNCFSRGPRPSGRGA